MVRIKDDKQPTPISFSNLLNWAKVTARADRQTYLNRQRSISLTRILGLCWPRIARPVFIVGAPRSGTTFLGDCISQLPTMSYHFEPVVTKAAARYVYEKRWRPTFSSIFYKSVYRWLLRIHFNGDLRFSEKTPMNAFVMDHLKSTFRDAVFIHIIRDGRDSATSLLKKPWYLRESLETGKREPGGYRYGPDARFWVEPERCLEFESTTDWHRCIWTWKRYTESAITGCQSLEPDSCLQIHYESVIREPERYGLKILEFLDLDDSKSEDALLSALNRADPSSIGRWKTELTTDQVECANREAGALLKTLSYQ